MGISKSFAVLLLSLAACAPAKPPAAAAPPVEANPAANEIAFIYSPGTRRPQQHEDCDAWYNQVPTSVREVARDIGARLIYVCPHATDGDEAGSYIGKRRDEIAAAVDAQIARGIRPSRIFLVGHSAGAWSSLMLMPELGKKFNAAVLFAPACCGPRSERTQYPIWLEEIQPVQIQEMLKAPSMRALVIAYPDDAFNRPDELRFLPEKYVGVELWPVACNKGHLTHLRDCQVDTTRRRIGDYVLSRVLDAREAGAKPVR